MTLQRRTFLQTSLGALASGCALPSAIAQQAAWPSRPLRMVVPFPPGGGTDIVARLVAEQLGQRLGQAVVVDNKPGAATVIGMDAAAKAPADGYTIVVSGASSFTVVPALRSKLPFDIQRDFTPLAVLVHAPLVLTTASDKPWPRMADMLAQARARPGQVRYASFGSGSAPHLAGELLAHAAGVDLEPIPYKGASEAILGVMRGDTDLSIDTLAAAMPHLRAGKLRALAVMSGKRTRFLPDTPGMDELNLSAAAFEAFYAMAAPAGLPAPVAQRLSREVQEIMALPEVREKCAQQSLEAVSQGGDALRQLITQEVGKLRALGQRLKLSLD